MSIKIRRYLIPPTILSFFVALWDLSSTTGLIGAYVRLLIPDDEALLLLVIWPPWLKLTATFIAFLGIFCIAWGSLAYVAWQYLNDLAESTYDNKCDHHEMFFHDIASLEEKGMTVLHALSVLKEQRAGKLLFDLTLAILVLSIMVLLVYFALLLLLFLAHLALGMFMKVAIPHNVLLLSLLTVSSLVGIAGGFALFNRTMEADVIHTEHGDGDSDDIGDRSFKEYDDHDKLSKEYEDIMRQ